MSVLFILFASIIVLAYWRVSPIIWTFLITIELLFLSLFTTLSFISLTICWAVFLIAAIFANIPPLRRHFFTTPLFEILKKRLPTISETEKQAIEAGNVWWEKDLFCGRPQWKSFFNLASSKLSSEEQAFLDNQVDTLCQMLNDWQIIQDQHDLPHSVWKYLKQERFFGLVIPKEYGGRGFSALAHSHVITKIATRSVSAAIDVMVPNSLGPGELLLHYGTKEQKDYYLPRLANGEEIPCFALTSASAGSDAASMIDNGIVCKQTKSGKEILGIRLSWDKRYITLAPVATVLGLAVKLYDPDNLLGKGEEIGITLCLVPRSHPGVMMGHRHLPMGLAFMNGPTRGEDVFIPLDWIIGGVAMAGQGWRMLMECLSIGRSISLPALSTAAAKLVYSRTGAYARLRRQFNLPLANFEGIEEALGQIAGLSYLMEATRLLTVSSVDLKVNPAIASAMTKYHLTELSRKIINHGMDIQGGHAIQTGPLNYLARAYTAAPIGVTVEGANILTRCLIIFGQGAIRCHPYVYQEVQLLASPKNADTIAQLDRLLLSHIGYLLCNSVRNIWYGLTGGHLQYSAFKNPLARYMKQLTRMSSALALLSDVTMMILGGNLKRRERISARLGDMLSQLYLASAVLKYFHDHGQPVTDLAYVQWCIETCLYEIQTASDDLLHNYPSWLGKLLKVVIFPYGRSYRKPKDSLTSEIVIAMLTPSALRDRLRQQCFTSTDANDPGYKLEKAFAQVEAIEPVLKKFQRAIRDGGIVPFAKFQDQLTQAAKASVISNEEARALADFENLYKDIIKVDEFSLDLTANLTP